MGEAVDGALVSLTAGRTRDETIEHLCEVADGAVIGLDFAFSFPAWWMPGASIDEIWARTGRDGEEWLAGCHPPFWGRPGRTRPPMPDHGLRRTELAFPGTRSVFQIGGAGAVGTGSVRGMPYLARLRAAGMAIWPFDAWRPSSVVAEVWPRSCMGRVVKSDPAARTAFLPAASSSPDAFDAACAAIALSLTPPPRLQPDPIDLVEGRILALTPLGGGP